MADNTSTQKLVSMTDIRKSFGKVEVLKGINFDVGTNEIVGLVGDNGAGKSTLIKILVGVHQPDGGEIYYKGEKITIHSVKRSREMGIETVYQERALSEQQNLWTNIFMGRELTTRFGFLKVKEQRAETEKILREQMGFTSTAISNDAVVRYLSGGEKQGIAIGRALYFQADLIILDEPTMGLSISETNRVLDFVANIKKQGKSAILISHNIYYVYPVSDRFYILDRGSVAGIFEKKDISQEELVDKMVQLAHTGRLNE
jgi:simple sugar transport system ATP-binding protein